MKAFREALVHTLDADGFADMYAQTIAYGLLSARIADPHKKTADDFAGHMRTNPFLRELMQTFLKVGGRRGKAGGLGIDFDELGVSEVVELLDDANMEAVVRDFGDRNPQEDPVIHFYELFLKEYDAKKRMQRGVFYTPRPVVSYIVRSVDELLHTEFGLEDGLADTATWGEMAKRHKDLKIPEGTSPDQAFVQILDPATGTGTFLVEAIDIIHKTLVEKGKSQGHGEKKIEALWNEYVPKHLLPRLHGYELLMAPYAIAHLKIGLKLYETGYHFGSDERARIYLTNTLEPAQDFSETFEFAIPALAHEAHAVNEVKRRQRFTVVIGNPPYSGNSSNRGEWIESLINDYRKVDGRPLGEVKVWLKDDYVKFLRFSEQSLESTGVGVLGFITNNSFFDGLTFRGMRHHLISNSAFGYFLNLHGNGNLKERAPDGSADENVFDILQGVGITLLVKDGAKPRNPSAFLGDLYGTRETKYAQLVAIRAAVRDFHAAQPKTPNYFLVVHDEKGRDEYEQYTSVAKLFEVGGLGFQSHRDSFVVALSTHELTKRMKEFFDLNLSDKEVKKRFEIDDYRRFIVGEFRRENKFDNSAIRRIQYRPFDYRYIYYARDIVQEWQIHFHGHLLEPNLGLNVMRQTKARSWRHVMVSSTPTPAVFVEIKDGSSQFPLYRYNEFEESLFAATGGRVPNLSTPVVAKWFARMQVKPSWLPGESNATDAKTPEDIFHYVYAVLHSPAFQSLYAEFLRIDFPRVPLTGNPELFCALSRLGGELVARHLMESPKLDDFITSYTGPKNPEVGRVGWSSDTVWLDAAATHKGQAATPGTIGFHGVPEGVWNFHIGGYQVCAKWLKDRKGRTLSKDDLAHYQRIVVALTETIRLMKEIDVIIEEHGGWPAAFLPNSAGVQESPDAALEEPISAVALPSRPQAAPYQEELPPLQKVAEPQAPNYEAAEIPDLEDNLAGPNQQKPRAE